MESGGFSFLSDLNLSALTLWIQVCLAKAEEMFSGSDAPHVDHRDGLTNMWIQMRSLMTLSIIFTSEVQLSVQKEV